MTYPGDRAIHGDTLQLYIGDASVAIDGRITSRNGVPRPNSPSQSKGWPSFGICAVCPAAPDPVGIALHL